MRRFVFVLLVALSSAAQTMPIQHVVIIIKENRSFDHMFGTFPGANGATSGMAGSKKIQLRHAKLVQNDLPHRWVASLQDIDHGKMDGFYLSAPHYASYVQFQQSDIPNYWKYAQTFALADNFFSSMYGGSFPNHLYFAAARLGRDERTTRSGKRITLRPGDAIRPRGRRLPGEIPSPGNSLTYSPVLIFRPCPMS